MKVLKSLVREEKKLTNFQVTDAERERMQEKADEYTNGNLSEWIRYAALTHIPRHKDLVRVRNK